MRNILTWRPLIYSSAEWNPTKSFVPCWIKIFESCHKKKLPRCCLINLSVCMPGSLNSLLASGDFCCLLITFENSLDPDKARHFVGPDLDPTCLTIWWYSWKIFFLKIWIFKKNPQITKKHAKLPSMQRVNSKFFGWSFPLAYHIREWTAQVLARLCKCVGSPEPLLLAYTLIALFLYCGSFLKSTLTFSKQ